MTQRYLPPGRGENPAFTPSRSKYDPGGMQGWVDLCYMKRTGWELNLQPVSPTAAPPRNKC